MALIRVWNQGADGGQVAEERGPSEGPGPDRGGAKKGQTALSTDERLTMASECVDWGQSGQSLFFCVAS